jgi:HEAT repeat protein
VPRAVAVRFLARFEGPVSLKTLHDLVLDGSVLVRRAAVESIADFARIDSVEVLGTALNDVDQEVKLQAVRGLGRINDLSVVRHLTFVCGDANPNVKRAALLALARIHDPSVVPTLQMGLVDPDVMVRSTALRGMIESDPANGPMFFQSALMWLPAPFIRELADNLGKEAIPYVREAVRSDNPELRLLAESILEGAGAEGLDALKAIAVETTFPEIRERVVRFLFTRAGRDALPLTVRFLDEQGGPVGVKVAVLDGLGDQRNPEDAPMAEKAFLDTDERVRVAAALAYLKMFDARIPSLPF